MTETAAKPTHAKKPRKRLGKGPKIVLGTLAGALVLLLVAVGVLALRLNSAFENVNTIEDAFPVESARPSQHVTNAGSPVNVLLIGTDTRDSGEDLMSSLGNRADTIMVAHIPPDRETVQIMSIMRDSWVEIPGHGKNKINAALSFGSVPLMVETVEEVIQQRIDHVAVIDFEGFKGLTEELGGIELRNDVAFSSGGHSFAQGTITIDDGDAALAYVRERYSFTDGDYQRVRNQQAFMRGVMRQLLKPSVLANPLRLADITDSVAPHVRRTSSLSGTEIAQLGASLVSANSGSPDINLFTMPTRGTGMIADQSVVYVDWDAVELVREAFDAESMTDFEAPPPRP